MRSLLCSGFLDVRDLVSSIIFAHQQQNLTSSFDEVSRAVTREVERESMGRKSVVIVLMRPFARGLCFLPSSRL
jgi:hypothetical protein